MALFHAGQLSRRCTVYRTDEAETALRVQRVFLVSGFFTMLQGIIGYRLTVNEGSGSMWFGYFIIMGSTDSTLGLSKGDLLSGLGLAVVSGGVVTLIMVGRSSWPAYSMVIPAITGTFSVLLALQLGSSYFRWHPRNYFR